jgi:hypothetical protein
MLGSSSAASSALLDGLVHVDEIDPLETLRILVSAISNVKVKQAYLERVTVDRGTADGTNIAIDLGQKPFYLVDTPIFVCVYVS